MALPTGVGSIVESGKKFIGLAKTRLSEEAIAGHAREEYPHAASTEPS